MTNIINSSPLNFAQYNDVKLCLLATFATIAPNISIYHHLINTIEQMEKDYPGQYKETLMTIVNAIADGLQYGNWRE